ncbi:energy transducer TonB [Hymenobacter wooponensis]|uniref:TonB C-terminal domain-containing protein n=1 Tax=Hymenobacter wooponensis TaxID=1525360 RepID=A0A4Z0MD45_9BACT|nr:energy transducer TonB [Hymenobacter wooponensis]TGD77297.1 hypothetical protein EU557_23320 [Hymenobacter wooponensis]
MARFFSTGLVICGILVSFRGQAQAPVPAADSIRDAAQVPDFAARNNEMLRRHFHRPGSYGWPLEAWARRIEGTVYVSAVIGADGKVREARALNYLAAGCVDTALALVRRLPWQPAQLQGQPVAVRLLLPVPFAPRGWSANAEAIRYNNEAAERVRAETNPTLPAGTTAPRFPVQVRHFRMDPYFSSTVQPAGGQYHDASGLMRVGFTVEADGRTTHPRVLAGVCPPCDSAVLTALRQQPRWEPARRGKQAIAQPVRVYVNYGSADRAARSDRHLPAPPADVPRTAEDLPRYPGGAAALYALARRTYAIDDDPGRATIAVAGIVQSDGRFTDAQVAPGMPALFREPVLAAATAMATWQPGRQGGRAVPVYTVLLFPLPTTREMQAATTKQRQATAAALATPDTRIYEYAEQMPALPDGGTDLNVAVQRALVLPSDEPAGMASVTFIVSATGTTQEVQVTKTTSPTLGQAAVAAVRSLPRLVPGRQNGRPVAVRYTLIVRAPHPAPNR